MSYEMYLLDRDLRVTQIVNDFVQFSMTQNYNKAGKWTLILPGHWQGIGGVHVYRNGDLMMSGITRGHKIAVETSRQTSELSGVDDLGMLENRLLYTFDTEYDERQGAAESVLKSYALWNFGAAADAERKIPGFAIEPDYQRGGYVMGRAKYVKALSYFETLAALGGIGFTMRRMRFDVYVPRVRRDVMFGDLTTCSYTVTAPKANAVLITGKGKTVSITDDSSVQLWGRIEAAISDTTDDEEKMMAKAREYLYKNRASVTVAAGLTHTDQERLLRCCVGDTVQLVINGGVYEMTLQQITITLDANGETIKPVFGTSTATGGLIETLARIDNLEERITEMEAI